MRVDIESWPGDPTRVNEDYAAVSATTMVLVDGAGIPVGCESGCVHGVAWYARKLAGHLIVEASPHLGLTLGDALAQAISLVADEHRKTCDLTHPGTPSSTVVIARVVRGAVEHLVLADSTLIIDTGTRRQVITDPREATVGADLRPAVDRTRIGTREHENAVRAYVEAMRGRRNAPGGFWVAAAEPSVAENALTGSTPFEVSVRVLLLSDGASRPFDTFDTLSASASLTIACDQGATALLGHLRRTENADADGRRWPRAKRHDDATVVAATITAVPAL